ncbi:uncharacterized protein LOC108674505 isoform X2 [Hyalella azteca]|uniref:Uncharacterized protein LOC108674505 isoform X2 n=1 Tax=Hyalella azteca TaxID=294128 RepID=A0A979FT04_HYAAZ|nr:uncharacterized protein LOC108674505 isoform X2 [Hyalella azteca]
MAKLLPLILAGILTTLLHEAQASLPPGPAVDVLVTPKGSMASCKKTKRSVVFQSIKSKKGIVYNRAYTHPEILKCFISSQPSAVTFRDCVNAAAVAGHSTLSFNGTTCSTYNATVPSHACADQKAAAANYIAIYQANPPLVKPNFGNFKVLTVAANLTASTNNNFDVTWTANDGGCNYPGFFVSFSGQEKYVETTSSQTTIENVPGCSANVTVSFGLPTGEKFGTTAQTVATTKPAPQNSWPFNVVPGYTMEANFFPNKTIIITYDASPGCGSFTKFKIEIGIKYTETGRRGPELNFPISEPKGTIEIDTADVPEICLTSYLVITYTQMTDGERHYDMYQLNLPLNGLGEANLYPYHQIGLNDVVFNWPTDLTPYDICGVLSGTNLTIKKQDDGSTFTAPISDGRITLPNMANIVQADVDVQVDSLGIKLATISVSLTSPQSNSVSLFLN